MSRLEVVPSGWATCRLGDFCEITQGQAPPSSSYRSLDGEGEIFLQGNAEFGALLPTPRKRTTQPQKITDETAVLLSVRAPVGATNLAPGRVAIGRGLSAIVPQGGVSREFVLWLLRAHRAKLVEQATGTTFEAVTGKVVRELEVLLPPAAEQRAILDRVRSIVGTVDAAVARFQAARTACDRLRTARLQRLLSAPAPRRALGEIADVFVGATPSRRNPDLWGGDIPWVSSGEVAFCRITSTRETITEGGLGNRERRLHPPGTVLLAMIGEGRTRGQAAILDIAAAHNQNSAAVRLHRDMMIPEYLYYCLMGMYERNRRIAGGSQQPALNGDIVRRIEVPVPSLAEQRSLVREAEHQIRACADLERRLGTAIERAETMRAAALHRAFTGRLTERTSGPSADALLREIADSRPGKRRTRRTKHAGALIEGQP